MGNGKRKGKGGKGKSGGGTKAQKKEADKARRQQQEQQKYKTQMEARKRQEAERKPKQEAMAEKAEKKRAKEAAKSEKAGEFAIEWSGKIKAIVEAVKALRSQHPERQGINAGNNQNVGTTEGGTDNPVRFTTPSNEYGITKGDIFRRMSGFDSSDSGTFKFRYDDIFVHAE